VTSPIRRVWIEEGCISCKVCEDLAPQVFEVDGDGTCIIRPDAAAHFRKLQDEIEQAAKDCPVEVIKLDANPAT
jgi:ferredoxin